MKNVKKLAVIGAIVLTVAATSLSASAASASANGNAAGRGPRTDTAAVQCTMAGNCYGAQTGGNGSTNEAGTRQRLQDGSCGGTCVNGGICDGTGSANGAGTRQRLQDGSCGGTCVNGGVCDGTGSGNASGAGGRQAGRAGA